MSKKIVNVGTLGHWDCGKSLIANGQYILPFEDRLVLLEKELEETTPEGLLAELESYKVVGVVGTGYVFTLPLEEYQTALESYQTDILEGHIDYIFEDNGTLVVEKNPKIKGHPQPFYRNGRW